jgi:endonuclease-3 related protein
MGSQTKSAAQMVVRKIYRRLHRALGPQHWWPAESPFEVIVGAILTQNTSWTNVERALAKLREANALNVKGIRSLPLAELEQLVRSSGYFRQKAERLKRFVDFLDERYGGSLAAMFATPTEQLRAELLALKGVGPETADSILLYGGGHEIFVVDAYTRRIFERHALIDTRTTYDELRTLVEGALDREPSVKPTIHTAARSTDLVIHEPSPMSRSQRSPLSQTYNEMHGLLVQIGKHYCLKQEPRCEVCPLRSFLPAAI